MLKGFREFILRGNIVDLAVGVVIGVAFNDLVTKFTADFVNPLIQLVSGGHRFSGSFKVLEVRFLWSDFINAVINFAIVAAVLYFLVVVPMNKLAARRRRGEGPVVSAPPTAEVALLVEIRDALLAGGGHPVTPTPRTAGTDAPVVVERD